MVPVYSCCLPKVRLVLAVLGFISFLVNTVLASKVNECTINEVSAVSDLSLKL